MAKAVLIFVLRFVIDYMKRTKFRKVKHVFYLVRMG